MFMTGLARASRQHIIIAACVALLALACGSGERGESSDATPTAEGPKFIGDIEPIPTPAVDPLDLPLTRAESITGLYTIDVPDGWEHASALNPGQEEIFQLKDTKGLLQAEIGITCEPIPVRDDGTPWTPREFAERDFAYVQRISPGAESSLSGVTVGDLQGIAMTYANTVGVVNIRQQAVYLPSADNTCMWTLRLRVFAPGDAAHLLTLFQRMVGTFRPV